MTEVSKILDQIRQGDQVATEKLLPLVYDELRKLAGHLMVKEKPGQTLQATALVHEAFVRLVDVKHAQNWNSRGHFFAATAEAMRRILIERARGKAREKHGGDWHRVDFEELDVVASVTPAQLISLNDALERLRTRSTCRRFGETAIFCRAGTGPGRCDSRHLPSNGLSTLGIRPCMVVQRVIPRRGTALIIIHSS